MSTLDVPNDSDNPNASPVLQAGDGPSLRHSTETDTARIARALMPPSFREQNALESFQSIIDALPQIFWTTPPEGGAAFCNRRFYDYTGLTFEEVQGAGWVNIVHPDDLPACIASRRLSLERGERWEFEYRLRKYDGTYRWFLARAEPVADEIGSILYWVGTATDIEEQKHAEREKSRFADLFRQSQDALIIRDIAGVIHDLNPAAERLYGYTLAEAKGKSVHELFQNRFLEGRQAYEAFLTQKGYWVGEIMQRRKDGAEVIVSSQQTLRKGISGEPDIVLASNRDITSERVTERRIRRLFDSQVVGVIFWNLETGLITDANDTFLSMVRYTREDLAEGLLDFRKMTPPEWAEKNEQGVAMLREQGSAPTYEKEYFRKDGSRVPILIGGTCFDGGGAEGFSYILDITEQKQMEQERERLLAETQARAEREALINQIGDGIRQAFAPEGIETIAIAALGKALAADRCYLMTVDIPNDSITVARDWCAEGVPSIAGRYLISDLGIDATAVFTSGRTLVVPDTRPESERRLSEQNAITNERIGVTSFLNVPFYDGNRIIGALSVAMANGPREWTAEEIDLSETVAGQLRSTVESARLQQRERNIAQQLQAALLPDLPEAVPGMALRGFYRAALEEAGVGGDFADVFAVQGGSATCLVVADLAGKGLAAASQVATVKNMLRFSLHTEKSPSVAMTRLNQVLVEQDLLTGFATLFVGIYDAVASTLTYVNCGQEPGLLWRSDTGAVELLIPTAPVLGGLVESIFTEECVIVKPGDILGLFTDGMTEVGPSRRSLLQITGLAKLFAQCCKEADSVSQSETALSVVKGLIAGTEEYAGSATAIRDDVALLVGVITETVSETPGKEAERMVAVEVEQEDAREDKAERNHSHLLQPLTTALLNCITPAEVVTAVVDRGIGVLGAQAGLVALLTENDQMLEVVRASGYSEAIMNDWRRFPVNAHLPLSDAVRENKTLLFQDRADWQSRYPEMMRQIEEGNYKGSASLPLSARGKVFGALHFSFPNERDFSQPDQDFLSDLAGQCALALDRALLLEGAERARDEAQAANQRLEFLARASILLGESLDYPTRLEALARLCVPEIADWAGVDVLGEDGNLVRLAVAHRIPEREAVMRESQRLYPPDPQRGPSTLTVIQTGKRVFYPHIPQELIDQSAVDAHHAHLLKTIGISAALSVPITARGRTLGALSLGMAPAPDGSGRSFTEEAVALVEELARCAAVAVDNARLYAQTQHEANERREASVRQRRFLKEMLAGFTEGRLRLCFSEAELPPFLTVQSSLLELNSTSLRQLRQNVEAVAKELSLPEERIYDFETAVHEAGMNAVKYGGGGIAHIHGNPDTGTLQVWVVDHGPGIAEDLIHRAVERGFTTGGFGHGMFFMQSCADRMYLLTGSNGTTVVLEQERHLPEPAWLKSVKP